MQSINQVTLVGRVGQPPNARTDRHGVEVVRFTVGTERAVLPGDPLPAETDWHNAVAFDQVGRLVMATLSRGDQVAVVGELRHERWKDRDGSPRRTTSVVVRTVAALGPDRPRGSLSAYPHREPANDSSGQRPAEAVLPF